MKKGVLILIDVLEPQGAENIAINIALKLRDSNEYTPFVCATRKGGQLEKILRKHYIDHLILHRRYRYELHKIYKLRLYINQHNIKIIHSHKVGSNFWGSIIGWILNIPRISHYHGHDKKVKYSTMHFINKLVGCLSTQIITISDSERQRLINNEGISGSKIHTIHNGIDYEKYVSLPKIDIRSQLKIDKDSPIVGIVASLSKIKNHELFLLAAREVMKYNTHTIFLIVGGGNRESVIKQYANQLNIVKNCIFTGFREDVADIISIMDVGVLTSHSEGIPLAILEYMALSKPVVCTNVGGLSEVVKNGYNGFLVDPGDYKMLAKMIILLLDNKLLSFQLGHNGLDTIRNDFSENTMMSKIKKIYSEILN